MNTGMSAPPAAEPQTNWKPLIVSPDEPMAARLRTALAQQGCEDVHLVPQYPRAGTLAGITEQEGCNVCFLDVASDTGRASSLMAEAAPVVQVVAVSARKDADLILNCVRLGAREFLSDPCSEEVRTVLERLSQVMPARSSRKRSLVICVMPGKAGCGASTLATYLAIDMKRAGATKILLVDTDPVTSTVAFLLKLKPSFHLGDAVRDWSRMDAEMWARMVLPCHGIDILPAPDDPAVAVDVQPRAAQGLLAFWRGLYDTVLLDVIGADAAGYEFAAAADQVLLVTTNELAALHATRRSLERLQKGFVDPGRLKIVVNRYSAGAGLKREAIETALGVEPHAYLSNDWAAVQSAVLDGKPVGAGSDFGRSIHRLAERLLGQEQGGPKTNSLFRLFRRSAHPE